MEGDIVVMVQTNVVEPDQLQVRHFIVLSSLS